MHSEVHSESSTKRCSWVSPDRLYIDYHDHEWGVPVYNDRLLFEFLILEGAQAGLSWHTILKKRAHYRAAFDDFDPNKVAGYNEVKIESLMSDAGIVRNRQKILAAIANARSLLHIQDEFNSFRDYIWAFVGGKPMIHHFAESSDVPALSAESTAMSHDLQRRGFKFVGPTICYAFMQATGMVMDHTTDCFRYDELARRMLP